MAFISIGKHIVHSCKLISLYYSILQIAVCFFQVFVFQWGFKVSRGEGGRSFCGYRLRHCCFGREILLCPHYHRTNTEIIL